MVKCKAYGESTPVLELRKVGQSRRVDAIFRGKIYATKFTNYN